MTSHPVSLAIFILGIVIVSCAGFIRVAGVLRDGDSHFGDKGAKLALFGMIVIGSSVLLEKFVFIGDQGKITLPF